MKTSFGISLYLSPTTDPYEFPHPLSKGIRDPFPAFPKSTEDSEIG